MKEPLEIGLLKQTQFLKLNHDVEPERHYVKPKDVEIFDEEDDDKVFLLKSSHKKYKVPELRWETEIETYIRGTYIRLGNQIWIGSLHVPEIILEETEDGFDSFVLIGSLSFAKDKYWVDLFSNWIEVS